MKKISKKNIERIIYENANNCKIFSKKELRLIESDNNKPAYVDDSGTANDAKKEVERTLANNPTATSAILSTNNFNNHSGDDTTKVTTTKEQLPNTLNNLNRAGIDCNVEVKKESIEYLRDNSVSFTKKEIREMFKR